MTKRDVTVEGGDLYRISGGDGKYYVQKVKVNMISNSYTDVGQARSLEDALTLIRAHSGRQIKRLY